MRSADHDPSPANSRVAATLFQPVPRRGRNVAKRFEAVVRLIPDAAVVLDADDRIRLVNHRAEELFGYSAAELLGQPCQLLVEDLHIAHQQHRVNYANVPQMGAMGASFPLTGQRSDGSKFPIEASLGPLDEGESLVIVSIRDVSERQRVAEAAQTRSEAALVKAQVSESRYHRLVDANIIGVAVTDTEHVLEANDTFLRLVGYTQADVQAGRLHRDTLTTPDTHMLAERTAQEAVATGASTPFEREYVRRDGSRVPVLIAPVLLQRDPLRLVNFVLDLTERKQLEQTLAERVAQLEAVMEAVPDALAVYDTVGHVLLANAAYHAQSDLFISRTSPDDTVAERFQRAGGGHDRRGALLLPDQWPQTRALLGEVFAGADAAEMTAHPSEGEPISFSITGAPLRDPAGDIIGAVTVSRDITEFKRLERERTEQAEQLNRIFEGIADGVVVYNAEGQPVRLNAAARRILGLDVAPAAYAQLPASDRAVLYEARDEQGRLLAPEDWPLIRVLSGQVRGADTREVQLRMLDGHEVEVITSAAPLVDKDGHLIGAVTILHDQTEQRRLAREREEARARELALEDTARHMDEFLAIASHDLRTPLTTVKSRVQLALRRFTRLQEQATSSRDALPDAEMEAVSASLLEASHSTDRLTRLVTLLFDVAQARSGVLELKLAPCDLAALVHRTVTAQQVAVARRRIELNVPEAVVPVEADPDRLDQVLSNFLSNALKYSPADQPVTVRLQVVENQAVVSVTDHGPGLPPEEQSRIWELFHRVPGVAVQSTSSESSGSLGLGLHICKQLMELHPGGRVGVESAVGKGSTFWFRLPLTPTRVDDREIH